MDYFTKKEKQDIERGVAELKVGLYYDADGVMSELNEMVRVAKIEQQREENTHIGKIRRPSFATS